MNLAPVVSTAQIGAQLDEILQSCPRAVAVAIRAPSMGVWPATIERRSRSFRIRWCESGLALREALAELDSAPHDGLVLVTPLADTEVPNDVAARLTRARVYQPRGWEILRQVFSAAQMDSRLGRYEWMPEVLIERAGNREFDPVPGGFLDLETAWREVLSRCLEMDSAQPDGTALMRWASQPGASVLLGRLPAKARKDALEWLSRHVGLAGPLIASCIESNRAGDAAPLGVVCGVVFSTAGEGIAEIAQAAVRLERYVADTHVSIEQGRAWDLQTRRLLDHASSDEAAAILDRADVLLRELRIGDWAYLNDWLPSGLEQRMTRYGQALIKLAAAPATSHLQEVEQTAAAVLAHRLTTQHALRAERVRMAVRLSRWLVQSRDPGQSLDDQIARHADDGAFVDWARFKLLGGDELPEVSAAYADLRAAVLRHRDPMNKAFAASLAVTLRDVHSFGSRIVPVESALRDLLAPIASAGHPVLVLVVDGLSMAIFRELFERPERHGWVEWVREGTARPLVGLAAFPTITEISRTSLLTGKVAVGAAAAEKQGFATHPGLLAASNASLPPRLFHKGDLSVDGNLAGDVRTALANPGQKVVGVVYNAVDDHLSGPDQLHQRWSLEDLRLLLPLLREARDSRRIVLLTADHGHVLEDGSAMLPGGTSDRWREGSRAADNREVALSGQRVLTPDGHHQALCLWSETARYTGRKNGYHGGASPAEAIVPMSILVPTGVALAGWSPAPPQRPDWWDLPVAPTQPRTIEPVQRPAPRRAPAVPAGQGGLFTEAEVPVPMATTATDADWVGALMGSAVYRSQKQLAARVALPDAQMRTLLTALDERGGKLTRAALAQRLAVAELRVGGLISAARRMLNVDQAPVLIVDEASDTVEFNRNLMLQQFGIGGVSA